MWYGKTAFALALIALLPGSLRAQAGQDRAPDPAPAKRLVNVDRSGLALQGYDPVAFFTLSRAVPGKPEHRVTRLGATYFFSSAENQARFDTDPGRYEPAFGGYCAYGVSEGGLFPVDISTAQIVGGRLVLNKNPRVRELFDREREQRMTQADREWPALVKRHGKDG